jgi:hypothetical protein
MIKNLFLKYFTKYYNLPPKPKALCDMVGIFLFMATIFAVVGFISTMGYWYEVFVFSMAYLLWSLVSLLYTSRVRWYELEEKYKNK